MKTATTGRILQKFHEVSNEFSQISIGSGSLTWRALRAGVSCIVYITHPNSSFRLRNPMVKCSEKINSSKALCMPMSKLLLLLICSGLFCKKGKKQAFCLRTSPSSQFYWIWDYIILFPAVNCPGIAIHHLGEVYLQCLFVILRVYIQAFPPKGQHFPFLPLAQGHAKLPKGCDSYQTLGTHN